MDYEIRVANLPEGDAVAIRAALRVSEVPRFIGRAFRELAEAITRSGAFVAGPPFARYYQAKPEGVDFEAVMLDDADGALRAQAEERISEQQAIYVEAVLPASKPVAASGRVKPIHLDEHLAAIVRHLGPHDAATPAYDAIAAWMREHGKKAAEPPREAYLMSLSQLSDPARWVTLVEQPLA